ncbi:leucine-rich PPR motif-containing protein, mitochondrial-like [Glandiceps talaboti]
MAALLRSARNVGFLRYLTISAQNVGRSAARNHQCRVWMTQGSIRPTALSSYRYLNTETVVENDDVRTQFESPKTEELRKLSYNRAINELNETIQRMGRITKSHIRKIFEELCLSGAATPKHALLIMKCCGSLLAEVPASERTEMVHHIWDKLSNLGVQYDVNHYNALLKVYLQNEHKFSPTDFLADMEAKGIVPNMLTHQTFIGAYCQQGDIQGAGKVLEFMKSKEMPITVNVFNSLITGHARTGDMENAKSMLTIMKNVGLSPTVDSYTSLMCTYAEQGDIDSIKELLQALRKEEMMVPDRNLMQVVTSFAKAGHKHHVEEILNELSFGSGYVADAINTCLTLMAEGHDDAAFEIFKTFPKIRSDVEGMLAMGEEFNQGNFFISQMVRLGRPLDVIENYIEEIISLGVHNSPYVVALKGALESYNSEYAYAFMRKIRAQGQPLRPHYLWPLMARYWQNNDAEGMKECLGVSTELDITLDADTFVMYVFPVLGKQGETLLAGLKEMGITLTETVISGLIRWELQNGSLNNVPRLIEQVPMGMVNFLSFRQGLVNSFLKAPNVNAMAAIIEMLGDGTLKCTKGTASFLIYQLLDDMPPEDSARLGPKFRQLFYKLNEQDFKLSASKFRGIRSCLNKHGLLNVIGAARKLIDPSELEGDIGNHLDLLPTVRIVDSEVLENHLHELKEKNMNTRSVLRKLILLHGTKGNYEKMISFMEELKAGGHNVAGAIFATLIGTAARADKTEEALKWKRELESCEPDFQLDSSKYLELAKTLTLDGRIEEALETLQEMADKKTPLSAQTKQSVFHLLNNVANKGMVEETKSLFYKCIETNIVKPSSNLLGPLVRSHLKKGDIVGALDCVMECHDRFRSLPMFHDVLVKLVEDGNKEQLQRAMDYGSSIVGERNVFFDLIFALLSAGKYKQAERIIETPGLRARPDRLAWYARKCISEDKAEELETLVDITKELFECDRDAMYMFLLEMYTKQNNWQKCLDTWTKMQEEDVNPRERTLRYLANTLKTHGQEVPFDIPGTAREMDVNAIEDSEAKYERLICLVGEAGNFSKAKGLLDDALSKDYEMPETVYNAVIKAGLQSKNLQEAQELRKLCKEKGITLDLFNSTGFILKAIEAGNEQEAEREVEDMVEEGKAPRAIVLKQLAKLYEDMGEPDKIANLATRFPTTSSESNIPYMKCLLCAYANKNDVDSALKLLEEELLVKKSEEKMGTAQFFQKIISNEADLQKAYELVDKLVAEGITFQAYDLMFALLDSGKVSEAEQLYEKYPSMQESKNAINQYVILVTKNDLKPEKLVNLANIVKTPEDKQVIYFYLMKLYEHNNDWQSALQLKERADQEGLELGVMSLKRLAMLLNKNNQQVPFQEPPESIGYYRKEVRQDKKAHSVLEISSDS